ncbi:MAG: hypothetical protein Aurels2KO_53260 [Aureliella sp.]
MIGNVIRLTSPAVATLCETKDAMQNPHLQSLLSCVLIAVAGCTSPLDFGGDTESKALTYKKYVADGGDAWFDPVGASDIYHRCYSTRDGYDAWWRFIISEDDCHQLVVAVAATNNGPADIEWHTTAAYPTTWQSDDLPPAWWTRNVDDGATSLHWCYDAGSAERRHGWYFLYDAESRTMYCWHWNHQWSSSECIHTNAG